MSVIAYFGAFWLLHFSSHIITQLLSKTYSSSFNYHTKLEWNKRVVGSLFSFGLGVIVYSEVVSDYSLWSFSLMYVCYDFSLVLFDQKSMTLEMVFHHITMAGLIVLEIYSGCRPEAAKRLLLTELSTPFLNMRWFLFKVGMDKHVVYIVNGLLLWLSFLIYRFIAIPQCLFSLAQCQFSTDSQWYGLMVGVVALLVLNYYWFWLITQKLFEVVFAKEKKGK